MKAPRRRRLTPAERELVRFLAREAIRAWREKRAPRTQAKAA